MIQSSNNSSVQEKIERVAPTVSLWSRSGPLLLLGAFAIFLCKCAPSYWPLTLAAFLGYAATRSFKKGGLYFSLAALSCVFILLIRSGSEPLWSSLLSGSIAVSLLLVYLGGKDVEALALAKEQEILSLQEQCKLLEKQHRDTKTSLSAENRESNAEIQRLNALHSEMALENRENSAEIQRLQALHSETALVLTQTKQSLENVVQEREQYAATCASFSQEIKEYQRQAATLQNTLEEYRVQLEKLNEIEQPSASSAQNLADLQQMRHQHALLREQFEEKSDMLDKARKELFQVENDYLSLQKAWEEKMYEPLLEDETLLLDLKTLEEECKKLESQVMCLEALVSSLILPKSRTRVSKTESSATKRKTKKLTSDDLPDLLQDKIDRKTSVES